jgi:hypothetical protein
VGGAHLDRRVSATSASLAGRRLDSSAADPVTVRAGALRGWQVPLWIALGLTLIAGSFVLTREGHTGAAVTVLFWAGFATMLAPVAIRLLADSTPRAERIGLVVLAGLGLYAVKVLRDPVMFVMSDEFTHLAAAQRIVATHHLFAALPLSGLVAAPQYPGLETVTVTLSQITGMALFPSGLIVIALARTILMLSLFGLYERVSGSARVAGLGALLFAGNGNFLYWSAQFSYESLALPLFVLALSVYVMRNDRPVNRAGATIVLALLIAAITATHHLTSYALAASLWALTLLSIQRGSRPGRALGLASFATAAAAAWFSLVATGTGSYLGFVAERTFKAVKDAAQGTHAPFQASAGSLQTPVIEQLVAFAGVLLVIAVVLRTLRRARQISALASPMGIFMGACAIGFVLFYPLRLFPGAWETANRAQEFLFIGAAMVLGLGVARMAGAGRRRRGPLVLGILVVICGAAISGWPAPLLLSQPLETKAGGGVIVPQGLSAARWAIRNLPPGSVYVGDEATGRELLVSGAGYTLLGNGGNVPALLHTPELPSWQRETLIQRGVDYVVLDRRKVSSSNQAAYFFQPASNPSGGEGYYPPGVRAKYAIPGISSIFDSGDIVIYDVRGLRERAPLCDTIGAASEAVGITCRTSDALLTLAGHSRTVSLPGMRLRLLRVEAQHRLAGLQMTLLVQVQNTGSSAYRPDPDWRHLYLSVGADRLLRLTSVPERPDNLIGTSLLGAGQSREGSLTFLIRRPALVSQVLAHGAELGVRLPSPPAGSGLAQIGVISIPPPGTRAPR